MIVAPFKMRRLFIAILVLLCGTAFPLAAQVSKEGGPIADPVIRGAESVSLAFEKVAETVTPSLVSVQATKEMPAALQQFGFPLVPFDEEAPGKQFNFPQGMGTGFIIDKNGHILTNNHVIHEADEVRVRLHDGRETKAEVVGQDPRTDVAVLKVDLENLEPLVLGDSDALRIGEWVVAAGSPFGFENSITAGIVSAKGRRFVSSTNYEDFIQTDAAINPGNSGGPLLDLNGKVVGINTAIFSRTGGYMGIGFAIPINMARRVANSLITEGKVIRGWLGVIIQPLTPRLAASFGFSGTKGVLVADVSSGGPGDQAGLKPEDIIVEYNGRQMGSDNELRNTVAATRPNTDVPVRVFRNGRFETISVKIGEYDKSPFAPKSRPQNDKQVLELGLKVQDLTDELKEKAGYTGEGDVMIVGINPGSAAARAGLFPEDIILKVGNSEINSMDDLREALKSADLEKGVRMVVENQGMKRFAYLQR